MSAPEFANAADEADHFRAQLAVAERAIAKLKADNEQLELGLKAIIGHPELAGETRLGLLRAYNTMKSAARSALLKVGAL